MRLGDRLRARLAQRRDQGQVQRGGHRRPPVARSSSTAAVSGIQPPGGGLHLVGGDGGQPGGELAGQLGPPVDQLGGGEAERAAEHRVGLPQQLRLGAGLHAAQLVGADAVGRRSGGSPRAPRP